MSLLFPATPPSVCFPELVEQLPQISQFPGEVKTTRLSVTLYTHNKKNINDKNHPQSNESSSQERKLI